MPIELHGPFTTPHWRLSIDGYEVPHVEVHFRDGDEDGPNWSLIIDRRFATSWVTRTEIERWAFAFANIAAICAGFTCHGENSEPLNRFQSKIGPISSADLASWRREDMKLIPRPDTNGEEQRGGEGDE